jgi:predicted ATPase
MLDWHVDGSRLIFATHPQHIADRLLLIHLRGSIRFFVVFLGRIPEDSAVTNSGLVSANNTSISLDTSRGSNE